MNVCEANHAILSKGTFWGPSRKAGSPTAVLICRVDCPATLTREGFGRASASGEGLNVPQACKRYFTPFPTFPMLLFASPVRDIAPTSEFRAQGFGGRSSTCFHIFLYLAHVLWLPGLVSQGRETTSLEACAQSPTYWPRASNLFDTLENNNTRASMSIASDLAGHFLHSKIVLICISSGRQDAQSSLRYAVISPSLSGRTHVNGSCVSWPVMV